MWSGPSGTEEIGSGSNGQTYYINDNGQIAGVTSSRQMFLWDSGSGISTFGSGRVAGIANTGEVAGTIGTSIFVRSSAGVLNHQPGTRVCF